MTRIRPQRIRLFGEPVDLTTPAEVMSFTTRKVAAGQRALIANHNTHSLCLMRQQPELREFYARADLIELDSIPMVYWGRLTGKPVTRQHRCTYLDWRNDFWRLAARHGWRVYYLGGAPGVSELAAMNIRSRFPGAVIGGRNGYFDMEPMGPENLGILAEINAFKPDIVMVGMGMPRQELWIAQNYDRLQSGVVFPVGAAFDYEAGVQMAAPRWLSKIGLEWAFRLATSPARLGHRYVIEPWTLLPAAIKDLAMAFAPRARPRRTAPVAESRKTLG